MFRNQRFRLPVTAVALACVTFLLPAPAAAASQPATPADQVVVTIVAAFHAAGVDLTPESVSDAVAAMYVGPAQTSGQITSTTPSSTTTSLPPSSATYTTAAQPPSTDTTQAAPAANSTADTPTTTVPPWSAEAFPQPEWDPEYTQQAGPVDEISDIDTGLTPAEYAALVDASLVAPVYGPDPILASVDGKVCPVAGPVRFIDDWGFPRSGGRTHKGNDLFADRGTPLVAVADGRVLRTDPVDHYKPGTAHGDLGGITVWLVDNDGVAYYYAHMLRIEPGITAGVPVTAGQVIGYLSNTGNARTTPPHTHFEVHPNGGAAVDPYPLVSVLCADLRG